MTTLETFNDIAVLTLNNPPGNKLEQPEFIKKTILLEFLNTNKSKALIIRGAGRHFSEGANLNSIKELTKLEQLEHQLNAGKLLLTTIYELDIPVICAIEGVCFGGGLEIALATHIRVISEKAVLAFPETMHGLMPGLAGNYLISRFKTMGQSLEMILTNTIIGGTEAVKTGLADYLCEAKQTFEFALNLARKMTDGKSHEVIQRVMKAIRNAYDLPMEQALKEETKMFCELAKMLDNVNE